MTYDQMMTHCKAGGKARRLSWKSDAVAFVEGMRLGVRASLASGETYTSAYHPTMTDKAANDWEATR